MSFLSTRRTLTPPNSTFGSAGMGMGGGEDGGGINPLTGLLQSLMMAFNQRQQPTEDPFLAQQMMMDDIERDEPTLQSMFEALMQQAGRKY